LAPKTGATISNGNSPERFRLFRLLGEGGSGKVYLAQDLILPSAAVALKVLNDQNRDSEIHRRELLREAHVLRMLNHPKIVKVFDTGEDANGSSFYTMEFVPGGSLKELLNMAHLSLLEALTITREIAQALKYLHSEKVIHCDLKPANILLDRDGRIRLIDFATAIAPWAPQLSKKFVGSSQYLAPEIWREERIDSAADLYSLGIIIYELVTGVLPFDGESHAELMWKHLSKEVVPPSFINPDLPLWLDQLLLDLLTKDASTRVQAADIVISSIDHHLPYLLGTSEEFNFYSRNNHRHSNFLPNSPATSLFFQDLENLPSLDDERVDLLGTLPPLGYQVDGFIEAREPLVNNGLPKIPSNREEISLLKRLGEFFNISATVLSLSLLLTVIAGITWSYGNENHRFTLLFFSTIISFLIPGSILLLCLLPFIAVMPRNEWGSLSMQTGALARGIMLATFAAGIILLVGRLSCFNYLNTQDTNLGSDFIEALTYARHSLVDLILLRSPRSSIKELNLDESRSVLLLYLFYYAAFFVLNSTLIRNFRNIFFRFFTSASFIPDSGLSALVILSAIEGNFMLPFIAKSLSISLLFLEILWVLLTWVIVAIILSLSSNRYRFQNNLFSVN
jgi:serine/threonine protein kinase